MFKEGNVARLRQYLAQDLEVAHALKNSLPGHILGSNAAQDSASKAHRVIEPEDFQFVTPINKYQGTSGDSTPVQADQTYRFEFVYTDENPRKILVQFDPSMEHE